MKLLRLISVFIPLTTALMAIIISAIPWGIPPEAAFVFPMITLSVLFYWALKKSRYLPVWLVFLLGLAMDLLTDSPMGYWSLIFLFAFGFAVEWKRLFGVRGFIFNCLAFAIAIILSLLLAWSLASLYFLKMIDIAPLVLGAGIALVVFPVMSLCLGIFLPLMEHEQVRPRRFGT